MARRLGADEAVDGHRDDIVAAARRFAPGGLDAALLTTGGKPADDALQTLADGGRAAYPNGVEPPPKPRPGISLKSYDGTPTHEAIEKLNRLIEKGPFEVHVARTFPLTEAAKAHEVLEEHFLGKIWFRPE